MGNEDDLAKRQTFYDIHMHAFNLSHPSLSLFVRRVLREEAKQLIKPSKWHRILWIFLLGIAVALLWGAYMVTSFIPCGRPSVRKGIGKVLHIVKKQVGAMLNMLAVLEYDVGSMFLLMENCLRHESRLLRPSNSLQIDAEAYSEIVLTPLMMDFGSKGLPKDEEDSMYHYHVPHEKPIVEQVVDVFSAIKRYMNTPSSPELRDHYEELSEGTKRVFRIYPFLGLNTANYELKDIQELMEKYFSEYCGKKEDLDRKMGQFDGNIDHLDSNFFAGIKVYPPLGFDPWPEDEPGRKKVEAVYSYAADKGIPITCHGGDGGFRAIPRRTARRFSDVSKWKSVLANYPDLKLNLAHFPVKWQERRRRDATFELLMNEKNENIYVDVSCQATNEKYYRTLKQFISKLSKQERSRFMQRLLFGSDFAVNLLWTESYNAYVSLFSETTSLTQIDKRTICSINPERFLFTQNPHSSG